MFRLAGTDGDCALLEFRPHRIDLRREVFFVRASIVLAPQRGWLYRKHWEQMRERPALPAEAVAEWELIPPVAVAWEPGADMPARSYWAYGAGIEPEDCARELARTLREETVPRMRRLLDRAALRAEIRDPAPDIRRRRPPGWAEVLLDVDQVAPADLESLFEKVETDYPLAEELIDRARAYAAAHSANR
ncbi:hypothetical protein ACFT7S_25755 [Streptomyces sp. NPDC057136]|uniref:hypothetical protein n=1 Tax=Streptomyces sp. NPDC057136 TaxID=3346029 RepID=UPI00363A0794